MSKRALLVGINDFAAVSGLRGCINDTYEMQAVLQGHFGFQGGEIKLLHDADATSQGIRDGLDWLLSDYEGGGNDVRMFHFSSHGTQVDSQRDDEWECQDEVIVTYDHDWDDPFRMDDLREIFDSIPNDVSSTFVADCSYSGSIQKSLYDSAVAFLPRYLIPPLEILQTIEALQSRRDSQADAWAAAQLAAMLQDVPPSQWAEKMQDYLSLLRKRFREDRYRPPPMERCILLEACEDRQTAADAYIEGDYRGAFTWALGKGIREANGDLTYGQLIAQASRHLRSYEQRPQLTCPPEMRDRKVLAPLGLPAG